MPIMSSREVNLAHEIREANFSIFQLKEKLLAAETHHATLVMQCDHRHTVIEGLNVVCHVCKKVRGHRG